MSTLCSLHLLATHLASDGSIWEDSACLLLQVSSQQVNGSLQLHRATQVAAGRQAGRRAYAAISINDSSACLLALFRQEQVAGRQF